MHTPHTTPLATSPATPRRRDFADRGLLPAPRPAPPAESHLTLLPNETRSAAGPSDSAEKLDLVWAVDQFYTALYRFGFSLSGNVSDAADLTQETYRVLLTKGGEIRDPSKVKTWLFTTLYRLFLRRRRRSIRFPEMSLASTGWELPATKPDQCDHLDGALVVAALQRLEEKFRTPLAMFYLQDLTYKEMAGLLGLPIGTIMSRLFRGKELLRRELEVPLPIAV